MDRSTTFRLIDLQTGGNLERVLRERYETGESCDATAAFLRTHYEVPIHGETVRRWFKRYLGLERRTS